MYARDDVAKHRNGARTIRNNIVMKHGGTTNRAGFGFVCEVNDSTKATRIIEFIYSSDDSLVLEMGDEYIRFIANGTQVRLAAQNITAITQANPAVVTIVGHGLASNEEVYITGVSGMTQINNRNYKITVLTADTFSLQDMDSTTNINSTSFTAYSSGGTAAEVYQITSPYQEDELFDINFTSSGDIITLAHPNHRPRELIRTSNPSWALSVKAFTPTQASPTAISASAGGAGANTYKYTVTAINEETFEESLPGIISTIRTITGATQANPVVITSNAHGYANGDTVIIYSVVGMTELNGRHFVVANVAANTFELEEENGTGYAAYSSGGSAARTFITLATAAAPTAAAPHTVSWTKATGAREYNVYKESNGVYGLIGIASGTSFLDIGLTADTANTPPSSRDPFIGAGNFPSSVTYVQQRMAFAGTDEDIEKIWMSRIGAFGNFTTSYPLQADDAITFSIVGYRVDAIKHMLDPVSYTHLTLPTKRIV